MSMIENKLKELNIKLPEKSKVMGTYSLSRWSGNTIYVSGNGPIKNGELLYTGKLGVDLNVEEGYEAARLSMINILGVLKHELGDLDRIERFVKLLGFVASANNFYEQPSVINGASDLLADIFGEKSTHARSAIGTNALPFNFPVEIEVIVDIKI